MRVPSNSPKYVCPRGCPTKIPEGDLEQISQDELEEFLRGREILLARFVADPASAATHGEATRLRAEIVRAEEMVQKLTKLYTKDAISVGRFGLLHQPQEQKLDEIERALAEVDSSLPDGEPPTKITAPDFVRHWLEFTPKTRRGRIAMRPSGLILRLR